MSPDLLLILPILVPLVTALLVLTAWRSRRLQRGLSLVGMALLVAAAVALFVKVYRGGVQVSHLGGWPAPYGIALVSDHLSAIMVLVTAIVGMSVAVYALADIGMWRTRYGFHLFLHILLAGVCGAFLTGDLFNLYVWFEVMLIASFTLMALGNTRAQLEGTVKYAILNIVGSVAFLAGIGLVYGMTGTLNMADVAVHLAEDDAPGRVTAVSMLFIVAFGVKAAVFPLFFWLPASYHTPPVAVAALFAGLLTKVGVYALIRVFTLLFTQEVAYTHTILLVIAGLTMVTGVLGAVVQTDVRRILSFHIISQIGYMVMGLALFTPLAILGSIFYIVHHIIVKTNLFLIGGVVNYLRGSFELSRLGGLYRDHPGLSMLFAIPALSLAGFPPFSGFWGKLILAIAGFEAEEYAIVAVALFVGLLTLYSMTKIFTGAFLAPLTEGEPRRTSLDGRPAHLLVGPVVVLAVLTLLLSFFALPLYEVSERAAQELLDPASYIDAVLNR